MFLTDAQCLQKLADVLQADRGVDFDFLASGETATVIVNYLISDGEDESLGLLTITVSGSTFGTPCGISRHRQPISLAC